MQAIVATAATAAGQYAGVGALVAISLAAAFGLKIVPENWLWILGLIPLAVGLRKLLIAIRARRAGQRATPVPSPGRCACDTRPGPPLAGAAREATEASAPPQSSPGRDGHRSRGR
jgi:hypothetical protein